MCLNVYLSKEEVPTGMVYSNRNDIFFGNVLLSDTPLVRRVLMAVDGASYCSGDSFVDRNGTPSIPKEYLSTGAKTLLNIVENPDVCFDVCECGNNALCLLSEIENGNVVWGVPVALGADELSCNICFRGKTFINFVEFQDYVREVLSDEQLCS